jgi:hypothetical protein
MTIDDLKKEILRMKKEKAETLERKRLEAELQELKDEKTFTGKLSGFIKKELKKRR